MNTNYLTLTDRPTEIKITSTETTITAEIGTSGVMTCAEGYALTIIDNGDEIMVLEPGFTQVVTFVGKELVTW